MSVAVIPARGGSKRIPRKNVRPFCGKPMIAWSIEAARASACFERILVSTDDEEIASVAVSLGAEAPFRRPAELSDDFAGTGEVMRHAVQWLDADGGAPATICCLYATAPFARPDDIRAGFGALQETGADYAVAVTTFSYPVQRALRINQSGRLEMLQPDRYAVRSQDLEETYHDAGQFYWGRAAAWRESRPILLSDAAPVRLPRERVQDVDTAADWSQAELLFELLKQDRHCAKAG